MRIGRWSELSVDSVCHEHEVMRYADANETSGELGSPFGGTLVGLSQFTVDVVGSKRHSLQAVELSQWTQAAVQIVSNLPAPNNGGPIYRFFGHAGHADPLDGWRCCSQKRVMSRPIQVRQL